FLCFPFLIFAYTLRGLELGTVLWGVFFLLLGALCANSFSLLLGSFCRTPKIAIVVRVLSAIALVPVILSSVGMVAGMLMSSRYSGGGGSSSGSPFADMPWQLPVLAVVATVLFVITCVVFSRSNLLFEAANATTLPR